MNEHYGDFLIKDLVNKDFGWKLGRKRNLTLYYNNCDVTPKRESCTLAPNDTITFKPCPKSKKELSWQGMLYWDGRHLSDKK